MVRAEAQAQRLARAVNHEREPFERYLANAYAAMLAGERVRAGGRPEVTVLVSHGVAARGWSDVQAGEVCKIPGVGPVAPEVARSIAQDAFLNRVFFDGKDLRHFKRWSRSIPAEVKAALELGDPPKFDGIRCVDCGNSLQDPVGPPRTRGRGRADEQTEPGAAVRALPPAEDRPRPRRGQAPFAQAGSRSARGPGPMQLGAREN